MRALKKTVYILLAAVLLVSASGIPAAAANGIKNHEHTLDGGTVTKAATCYTAGWMTYTCTDPDCNYVYREAIPATGHRLDAGTITVKPTCTGFGEVTYKCLNPGCIYMTSHIIPYTGHRMELDEVISEPTCTKPGVTRYACAHDHCHAVTMINFPALGHRLDEGTLTVEPTCTSSGTIEYACTRDGCDYTKTQWVAPIAHSWDEGEISIQPTEYSWGRRIYTCTVCGTTYPEAVPPFSAIFRLGIHGGRHYTVNPDVATSIRADGEMNFSIIIDDGWKAGEDFTVSASRAQIRQEQDGSYTIYGVEADTNVTVTGIVADS